MAPAEFFYPYAFSLFGDSDPGPSLIGVPENKNILLWSQETVSETQLRKCISVVQALGLQDRVRWLLQPSHDYPSDLLDEISHRLYLLDLDLLFLDLHLNVSRTSIPNTAWQANTGRFLFPTGKPDRPNRIRLLYKFWQAGLLEHCDWSLFVDHSTRHRAHAFLPELGAQEFERFVQAHARNLDGVAVMNDTANSNHSHGYPFDGSLYGRCSFRVISETQMLDQPVVTEKTWITMANHMPFIMSGYAHNLRYLHQIGYRTFERYLPCADYDTIEDQEDRLDAVVENARFWQQNIHGQRAEISQDIRYNHDLLSSQVQYHCGLARMLARDLGEPDRSIYSLVPLSLEHHRWAQFYHGIKDSTWPDCMLEEDFHALPLVIQDECIDKFGYHAKHRH